MRPLYFSLILLVIASCNTSSQEGTTDANITLLGDYELTQESINDEIYSYSEAPVKSVLSFQENGYFIYFDDLKNSNLDSKINDIQEHYKGQFEVQADTLILSYMENQSETSEYYVIEEQKDGNIVLKNTANNKAHYYSKR